MPAMSNQPNQDPWTVLRLIDWTREYFARQGVDSPRLATEVLLAHVLGCKRVELYARFDHTPAPDDLAGFRELVARAAKREPVAYLVGHREFYSLAFDVSPAVLIPRPETELLVDLAVERLKALGQAGRYWDACTGSGAVAIATAKHVGTQTVLATDISADALAVASRNVEKHHLGERITLAEANLLGLPDANGADAPFDVITANPPYVTDAEMTELPAEVKAEPILALAAGADGLDCIRPILQQAANVLNKGGMLAMEIGAGQAGAVWDLVNQTDYYAEARLVRDSAGIERVLVATATGAATKT